MATNVEKGCIGLTMDIAELRAVELSGTPENFRIVNSGSLPMPAGIISDGIFSNIPAAVDILNKLLSGFSQKAPIIVGAKNQNVLMRMATLPNVAQDKMRGLVTYQAQKFIPIPVIELVIDYVPCGEIKNNEEILAEILLVGARKTYLNNLIAIMEASDRILGDVDSAMLATTRILMDKKSTSPIMFVDIDHEIVGMMVFNGENIKMTRNVSLPAVFKEVDDDVDMTEETIDTLVNALSSEMRSSLTYYSVQKNSNISKIYMRAFFPKASAIAKRIESVLDIPVIIPEPFINLRNIDTLDFATCISLAKRGLAGVI